MMRTYVRSDRSAEPGRNRQVRVPGLCRRTHRSSPEPGRLALLPKLPLRVEGLHHQWAGVRRRDSCSPAQTASGRAPQGHPRRVRIRLVTFWLVRRGSQSHDHHTRSPRRRHPDAGIPPSRRLRPYRCGDASGSTSIRVRSKRNQSSAPASWDASRIAPRTSRRWSDRALDLAR